MRQYLLPEKGKFYKANLHMHTTVSDGANTPQEVKEAYQKEGCSIVAFSDHEVMVPHNELTDCNFLALTAFEKSIDCPSSEKSYSFRKTAHLNLFAKDRNAEICPVMNASEVWGNARKYINNKMKQADYRSEYSESGLNDIIHKANESGFLVCLNHPVWSLQNYQDYIGLKGLWGIECYNTGCVIEGYPDTAQPLDDLLRAGQNVFPVYSDDAHGEKDRFGGYVMIKAENLEYDTIMNAFEKGDFYSTSAPEIHSLYIEDDILTVECSPVVSITVSTERRSNLHIVSEKESLLTHVEFNLGKYLSESRSAEDEMRRYFRVTVIDERGRSALSRAYFTDELK